MDKNNIISAPQVNGFNSLYKKWQENHTGSKTVFLSFMTTPSREREEFIMSLGDRVDHKFSGLVVETTVIPSMSIETEPVDPGLDEPIIITIS